MRSTSSPAALGPRRGYGRAPPTCRGRSSIAPIGGELSEESIERHDRRPGRRGSWPDRRGRDEAAPYGIREQGIRQQRTASFPGRDELGHDSIAIRDEDRFAPGGQTHVLAQLV